jgi:8-oxo-(d)GTP phosphatase
MVGRLTIAAGVVALDSDATGFAEPRVLLVHRPAYDDWSLPKGKVHAFESLPACATRETLEETGAVVRLGAPVGVIRYPVSSGPKEVHYWLATLVSSAPRRPDAEVDKAIWLPARAALVRMTYGDERALVDRALAMPPSTPLLVVRHGKAVGRSSWTGTDPERPVDERGRRQSAAIVPLLAAYGVGRLESSSSTRCLETLAPYAAASGLKIRGRAALTEESAKASDEAVQRVMARLAEATSGGLPTAVCGHRPVLPAMLAGVGLEPRPLQTGEVAVAHLDADGAAVATEFHEPQA